MATRNAHGGEPSLAALRAAFIAAAQACGRDFARAPCKPLLLYADHLYRRRTWWRAARAAVAEALLGAAFEGRRTGDVTGAVDRGVKQRIPWQILALLDDPTAMLDIDAVDVLALSRFAEALPGWDAEHCPFGVAPLDPAATSAAGEWPADAEARLRAIDYDG